MISGNESSIEVKPAFLIASSLRGSVSLGPQPIEQDAKAKGIPCTDEYVTGAIFLALCLQSLCRLFLATVKLRNCMEDVNIQRQIAFVDLETQSRFPSDCIMM